MMNIGIPVSVGIAPTKTLAKMANRYSKKKFKQVGIFYACNEQLIDEMLRSTDVSDIWGIGRQHSAVLKQHGFTTAWDVTNISPDWMRSNMSVVGLRLWNELRGIPSIESEYEIASKKNICTSRSFGKTTGDRSVLKEAASNYAALCALKLRRQNSCATSMQVFLNTNQHKTDLPQYHHSITLEFETATNLPQELIGYASKGLDIIYRSGYLFKKVGITVMGLVPADQVQQALFDVKDRKKGNQVLIAMDEINNRMGKDLVRIAAQGFDRRYRLRAEHLSRRYTTRINEILKITI